MLHKLGTQAVMALTQTLACINLEMTQKIEKRD